MEKIAEPPLVRAEQSFTRTQKRYRLVCYPRVFDKSSWSPDSQYYAASVSGFKFPNDGQLSWDIKEAEIWRAWSDRYTFRTSGATEIPIIMNNATHQRRGSGLMSTAPRGRGLSSATGVPSFGRVSGRYRDLAEKNLDTSWQSNPLNYAYSYWLTG